MPKKNQKIFVSKRHMLRRVADEVSKIYKETTGPVDLSSDICVDNDKNAISDCDLKINSNNAESSNTSLIRPLDENVNMSTNNLDIVDDFHYDSNSSKDMGTSKQDQRNGLVLELRSWATSHHVPHSTVTHLLHILKPYHSELPNDSRTLLKTPTVFETKKLETGEYIHLGLKLGLETCLQKNKNYVGNCLSVSFNIDGLPLYSSSNLQLWPILGLIKNTSTQHVFPVGIFCGNSKPVPLSYFLENFIDECIFLTREGFIFQGKKFSFEIHSFICDAPAKAFIKCIKGPTGYSCCDKCTVSGVYNNRRIIFKDFSCPKRTDDSFRKQQDEDHHIGNSPLINLNINMIDKFPIDYMHNVCLGVMRKLLKYWVEGHLSVRLSGRNTKLISDQLMRFRDYIPTEINRKTRSLNELKHFKASEYRTFLLYAGIVALKGNVSTAIYNHFLLLHCGITCLVKTDFSHINCQISSNILNTFIEHGGKLYGKEFYIYNVHVLSHLSDDSIRYGPLDEFSAFPFENYLGQLKNLLKTSTKPLQQICRRLCEINSSVIELDSKENFNNKNIFEQNSVECLFRKLNVNNFVLSVSHYSKADSYCFTDHHIFQIEKIAFIKLTKETLIYGKYFTNSISFYNYPFDSTRLNIHQVSNLSDEIKMFSITEVKGKCILLPFGKNWVAMPILHTLESHKEGST